MMEAKHVKCTGVIGDTLWGTDLASGYAVVWDQRRASFRLPTSEEQMGADAHAHRTKRSTPARDAEDKS